LNNVWLDTFLSLSRVQLLYIGRHRVRQWRHSQRCRCIQYTCPYVDELNEYNVVSARKDVPPKKRERERRESLYDILLLRILSFLFFLVWLCVCVWLRNIPERWAAGLAAGSIPGRAHIWKGGGIPAAVPRHMCAVLPTLDRQEQFSYTQPCCI
jgi:hypothetical protein